MMVFQQSIFSSVMRAIFITALLVMAGCARTPVDKVDLIPAPDVYGNGLLGVLFPLSCCQNSPQAFKGVRTNVLG
jgi:hypothetical protein